MSKNVISRTIPSHQEPNVPDYSFSVETEKASSKGDFLKKITGIKVFMEGRGENRIQDYRKGANKCSVQRVDTLQGIKSPQFLKTKQNEPKQDSMTGTCSC